MNDGYKLCPRCEEEYTLTALQCAECGVALVLPGEVPAAPEPDEFPDVDALACVRVGPLPWTRALSEGLLAADIEHRVERDSPAEREGETDAERFGGETVYGTWVRPSELARAKEIDGILFAHFEPESADELAGEDTCPACQEPLAADALSCPECGLAFG